MKSPQFIYFDLGNVLLHFDHKISCRALADATGVRADTFEAVIFASGLQRQYESGEISSEQFANEVAQQTQAALPVDEFLRLCSDIFQLNAAVVPVIEQLRTNGRRLGILSNTCQAHWEFVLDGHLAALRGCFDVCVLSYEEKSMKPSPQIYQAAIAAAGVPADQIFFTDDRPENVDAARQAGLDATQFHDVVSLMDDLSARHVLPGRSE